MRLVYNLSTAAYHIGIRLAAPFNPKAKKWVDGRKKWANRLKEEIDSSKEFIWFHCASLGEFEQGRPIIEAFRLQFPSYHVLLTFYSPSGYEVRKDYNGADIVMYLPGDSASNAAQFLDIVKPRIAVFVKYEFWFHYLSQLQAKKIPTLLVSGIFRPDQHFFKWYGGFAREMLKAFDHFFVQDVTSQKLLENAGLNNSTVSGDNRFDRVAQVATEAEPVPEIELFLNNQKAVVAGSSWPKDEDLLSDLLNSSCWKGKMIIAPHEVHKGHIQELEDKLIGHKVVLFSNPKREDWPEAEILIVDSIGLLGRIYRYGWMAFVGGGFGSGIHNILEPATFGLPTAFGPNWHKFNEAKQLIERGGACSVSTSEQLITFYENLSSSQEVLDQWSENARNYVVENTGATEPIIAKLKNILA